MFAVVIHLFDQYFDRVEAKYFVLDVVYKSSSLAHMNEFQRRSHSSKTTYLRAQQNRQIVT